MSEYKGYSGNEKRRSVSVSDRPAYGRDSAEVRRSAPSAGAKRSTAVSRESSHASRYSRGEAPYGASARRSGAGYESARNGYSRDDRSSGYRAGSGSATARGRSYGATARSGASRYDDAERNSPRRTSGTGYGAGVSRRYSGSSLPGGTRAAANRKSRRRSRKRHDRYIIPALAALVVILIAVIIIAACSGSSDKNKDYHAIAPVPMAQSGDGNETQNGVIQEPSENTNAQQPAESGDPQEQAGNIDPQEPAESGDPQEQAGNIDPQQPSENTDSQNTAQPTVEDPPQAVETPEDVRANEEYVILDGIPQTDRPLGLAECAQVADSYFDDAVFIGDSVTLKLNYYVRDMRKSGYPDLLGKAKFLTAGSMGSGNALESVSSKSIHPSYQGTKMSLEDAVATMGAKKVYIMLGMNDIAVYGIQGSADNMMKLIARIIKKSPGVEVFVQSATPRLKGNYQKLNNNALFEYDLILNDYCKKYADYNLHFVDVAYVMRDAEGNLPGAYCSDPDGQKIHFTEKACVEWIKYLYTHALTY